MEQETFQTIGAALGVIGTVVGGIWAAWRFFLFGELARVITVDINARSFADEREETVLAEVTITNKSKTRTEVREISYRPIRPAGWSRSSRMLARIAAEWQRIGGGAGDTLHPGEALQGVIVVAWPKGQRAVPVQFEFRYVESIDARGLARMLRSLITFRWRGEEDSNSVIRLVTAPDSTGEERKQEAAAS